MAAFKAAKSPQDEIALDTLEVFLRAVLGKRYTNASSDVIAVLTGLDRVDAVFTDFVAATDNCIKGGRSLDIRRKAVRVALCIGCGAFNTGLLSYFHHRDLFPGIMKVRSRGGYRVAAGLGADGGSLSMIQRPRISHTNPLFCWEY